MPGCGLTRTGGPTFVPLLTVAGVAHAVLADAFFLIE